VFEAIARPAVLDAMDGINCTVFAYGQTGSGKTFTVTGGTERYADRGLIPRALAAIFAEAQRRASHSYSVTVSYLELYNEEGYDLLDPTREVKRLEDLPKARAGASAGAGAGSCMQGIQGQLGPLGLAEALGTRVSVPLCRYSISFGGTLKGLMRTLCSHAAVAAAADALPGWGPMQSVRMVHDEGNGRGSACGHAGQASSPGFKAGVATVGACSSHAGVGKPMDMQAANVQSS
jgi:hypothetical protein